MGTGSRRLEQVSSVGVGVLDDEHVVLIGHIDRLRDAMRSDESDATITVLLDELTSFLSGHCRHEEELMREHGFPEAESHAAVHQATLVNLAHLRMQHTEGHITAAAKLWRMLEVWLRDHFRNEDGELGRFLRARGLAQRP
jgi:hemerythrin